jgi:hypothetical protein
MHNVNLLPVAAAQRFQRNRIVAAWSKLVLSSLLITIVLIYVAQSRVATQSQAIEAQRLAAKYPREVQSKNQQLRHRVVSLGAYESQQATLRSQFSPLVVVAGSLEFVDRSDLPSKDKEDASNGYVALQLVTDDTAHSSAVMQALRESGYFGEVKLSSALEKLNPNSTDLRFSVRCNF